MIYVIMYRRVSGGVPIGSPARVMAAAFVVGAAASGIAFGLALGWIGGVLTTPTRAALGGVFGVTAAFVGASDVLGSQRLSVLQFDRETNQRWLWQRPALGALATGAVIGAGFATRIGFWLWYVVPLSCLLVANAALGAGIYGTYAVTRAAIPALLAAWIWVLRKRDPDTELTAHWLQEKMMRFMRPLPVRACCGVALILVGAVYFAS